MVQTSCKMRFDCSSGLAYYMVISRYFFVAEGRMEKRFWRWKNTKVVFVFVLHCNISKHALPAQPRTEYHTCIGGEGGIKTSEFICLAYLFHNLLFCEAFST